MGKNEKAQARYYPLFLAIEGRTCLVVGAGAVGERKVRTLLKYGANVRIVARELSAWLDEKSSEKSMSWAGRLYERSHLAGSEPGICRHRRHGFEPGRRCRCQRAWHLV